MESSKIIIAQYTLDYKSHSHDRPYQGSSDYKIHEAFVKDILSRKIVGKVAKVLGPRILPQDIIRTSNQDDFLNHIDSNPKNLLIIGRGQHIPTSPFRDPEFMNPEFMKSIEDRGDRVGGIILLTQLNPDFSFNSRHLDNACHAEIEHINNEKVAVTQAIKMLTGFIKK